MKKVLGMILAAVLAMLPCATTYAAPGATGEYEHVYTLIQPVADNVFAHVTVMVTNNRYPGYVSLYMSGISKGWDTGYDSFVVIASENGEVLGGPGVEQIDGKPIRYIRYHDGMGLFANIKEGFPASISFTDWDGSGELIPGGILLADGRMISLQKPDQVALPEGLFTEYAETVQYGGAEHTGVFAFCADQSNNK